MASNSSVDDAVQINIELEDLHELARINPLAWEQLLHISDNRQNAERISELEDRLSFILGRSTTRAKEVAENGHDVSKFNETASEPA